MTLVRSLSLDRARAVADAVLFEAFDLYPYGRTARERWQSGVLAPQAFSELDGRDPSWLEAQILVEDEGGDRGVSGTLRFLRLRRRRVYAAARAGEPMQPVDSVDVDGRLLLAWDEGEVQEVTFACPVGEVTETALELSPQLEEETFLAPDSHEVMARVEHARRLLRGRIRVRSERLAGARSCCRITVRVDNETPWQPGGSRDDAMAVSMLGAHLMLFAPEGRIVSLIDPPEWASGAAAQCRNVRVFPVLVGNPCTSNLALASPIILHDFPAVAPESLRGETHRRSLDVGTGRL
jgi:hypothetical protein